MSTPTEPTVDKAKELTPEVEAPVATEAAVITPASEEKSAEPTQEPPTRPRKKTGKSGWLMDSALVLALVGIIGGGAWFIQQELEKYNVPSPMELAQNEYLELCKQHEQLQEAAYRADEQIRMRDRIAGLETQLLSIRRQIAERRSATSEEESRVHSLQREIRQEDKTSRAVARSLLVGLPIGNAATTSGRAYPNAIIHRLKAGRITLRFPEGQATFPLSNLVKDNLPDIARYALGLDDMVDMSDFDKMPKRRKGKLITPRKAPTQVAAEPAPSYEPEPTAPVVNTQAPAVITVEPGGLDADSESWEAPEAPLPIEE